MKMKNRYEELDSLKGLAIILVYLGHCFQLGEINLINNSFANLYIFRSIYSFHMPLFFIISGFVSNSSKNIKLSKFYKNKVLRLLIPYFFINLLDFIPRTLFPNLVNSKFAGIEELLFNGTKISWFIYTLFIIFIIFPLLNRYILKKDDYYLFGMFLFIINYLGIFARIRVFALNSVIYYLIYFYLGYILKEKIKNCEINKVFVGNIGWIINSIIFIFFSYKFYAINLFTSVLFALSGSLFSLNLILRIERCRRIINLFKFIGVNSLTFYLLEGFISVVYRSILIKIIPLEYNFILILSSFFLKILTGCIVIKYIVIKNTILSFLLGAKMSKV